MHYFSDDQYPTVESLYHDSTTVLRVRVTSVSDVEDGRAGWRLVQGQVTGRHAGPVVGSSLSFATRRWDFYAPEDPAKPEEYLCFLRPTAGMGPTTESDGCRTYLVPAPPAGLTGWCAVKMIRLNDPEDVASVWTRNLMPTRSPDELLSNLASEIGHPASPNVTLGVPGTQAGGPLRHCVQVLVPADPKLLQTATQWLDHRDPTRRLNALTVIAAQPKNPLGIRQLRRLLDDPFSVDDPDPYKLHTRSYPVRHAANLALVAWGVWPDHPVLVDPDDRIRPVAPRTIAIWSGAALIVAFLVGFVARWGSRSRIAAGTCAVSATLCTAAAVASVATYWRFAQLTFPRGADRWEVALSPAGLQVTHMEKWPMATSHTIGILPADERMRELWDLPMNAPPRNSFGLFAWDSGEYTPMVWKLSGAGTLYWHVWRVPYWSIMVLCALLPARTVIAVWAARLAHARQTCRKCGYDLRASTERCPECGTAIPRPKPTWRDAVARQRAELAALERLHEEQVAQLAIRLQRVR